MNIRDLLDHFDETCGLIVTDYDLIDRGLHEMGLKQTTSLGVAAVNDWGAADIFNELDGFGLVITDEDEMNDVIRAMTNDGLLPLSGLED